MRHWEGVEELFIRYTQVLKAPGDIDFQVDHTGSEQRQQRGELVRAVEIDNDTNEAAQSLTESVKARSVRHTAEESEPCWTIVIIRPWLFKACDGVCIQGATQSSNPGDVNSTKCPLLSRDEDRLRSSRFERLRHAVF